MKKIILTTVILGLFLAGCGGTSGDNPLDEINNSQNEGSANQDNSSSQETSEVELSRIKSQRLDFTMSERYCAQKGYRLPTIEELKAHKEDLHYLTANIDSIELGSGFDSRIWSSTLNENNVSEVMAMSIDNITGKEDKVVATNKNQYFYTTCVKQ
jgi:hypothetical protein